MQQNDAELPLLDVLVGGGCVGNARCVSDE